MTNIKYIMKGFLLYKIYIVTIISYMIPKNNKNSIETFLSN